jgi:hypothetical protein
VGPDGRITGDFRGAMVFDVLILGALAFALILGEPTFDPDLVLPGVAEVILVDEPLVGSELEVIEPDRVGIVGERESPHPADAIVAAVDAEPVEMEVTPAEGNLEHVMELGEGAVAADQ